MEVASNAHFNLTSTSIGHLFLWTIYFSFFLHKLVLHGSSYSSSGCASDQEVAKHLVTDDITMVTSCHYDKSLIIVVAGSSMYLSSQEHGQQALITGFLINISSTLTQAIRSIHQCILPPSSFSESVKMWLSVAFIKEPMK